MRDHDSTSLKSTRAPAVAMLAAILLASATLPLHARAQDPSTPTPAESAPDSARAYSAPASVANGQRIRRIIDEGTHVVLTDGSVWEVYLPDRPAVSMWKPGDLLVVREAPVMQGEYDYTLKDGRTRKPVSARLVGDLGSRS